MQKYQIEEQEFGGIVSYVVVAVTPDGTQTEACDDWFGSRESAERAIKELSNNQ
jgi:hypothetical protein